MRYNERSFFVRVIRQSFLKPLESVDLQPNFAKWHVPNDRSEAVEKGIKTVGVKKEVWNVVPYQRMNEMK